MEKFTIAVSKTNAPAFMRAADTVFVRVRKIKTDRKSKSIDFEIDADAITILRLGMQYANELMENNLQKIQNETT